MLASQAPRWLLPKCKVPNCHARELAAAAASASGLFGIKQLQQPRDFEAAAQDAVTRGNQLVSQILQHAPTLHVVELMDELSDVLCRVYDAAECCRQLHSQPAWRDQAHKACMIVIEYISSTNADVRLHDKLDQVCRANEAAGHPNHATSTQQDPNAHTSLLVGRSLLLDFKKAGVHLPLPIRDRVRHLVNQTAHFPARFNQALTEHGRSATLSVPGSSGGRLWAGEEQQLPLDCSSLVAFLASEPDEAVRKQVYLAGYSGPPANLDLLDHLISVRHEMARLLGYPSYAHFKLEDMTLAQAPEAVVAFLHELADALKPLADKDVQVLRQLKAQHSGQPVDSVAVHAWDVDFLSATAKSQAAVKASQVSQYLTLDSVLDGLSRLLQRVFRVTLCKRGLGPGEGWTQGVMALEVVHADMGPLGTLYLDLFSSEAKAPGAALYPVRCGRQLPGGAYQLPILVLALDLGPPSGSGSTRLGLRFRDVHTLLHETGHAMHCLLSRTKHQHLWGTRCAADVVELPSHLFEHFLLDHRSFSLLTRHTHTGDPMPAPMHADLVRVSKLLASYELQHQVLLSLVDQAYFGPQRPGPGQTGAVWQQLAKAHSSVPFAPGSQPQARFSHLTVYGATYYSYLFARCLSAAVWDRYLAGDPLDGAAGACIADKLFAPGGAKEPAKLIQDMLGSDTLRQQGGGWVPKLDYGRILHCM